MSSTIKPIRKLQDKTTPKFLKFTHKYDVGRSLTPDMPELPDAPRAPTIDDAAQNRDMQDRIRRRRGVLANIFAGNATGSGPSGGNSTLG